MASRSASSLDAVIGFIAVALLLFLVVEASNRMQADEAAEDPTAPEAPAPEVALLTEICDELRASRPD